MRLTGAVTTPGGPLTASLDVAVTPAGPAKFSTLYGLAPQGEVIVDRNCYLDRDDLVVQQLRVLAGVTLDARQHGLTLSHPQARLVCAGTIDQRQPDPAVTSFFQFRGIDETSYVGGDDGAHADPGFQIHGTAARWLLEGAQRTRSTVCTVPPVKGARALQVADCAGWRAGDRLVVAPTEPRTVASHWKHHDDVTIQSVDQATRTVTLTSPLLWPHPQILFPASPAFPALTVMPAVVNLTSNVGVKGELGHRAHVMGHHSLPRQTWRQGEIAWCGPRKITGYTQAGAPKTSEGVLGRYGLHLHHNADTSRGSVIEDMALHDLGHNGVWTHASHGVTVRRNVVHDLMGTGFGWDMDNGQDDASHDYVEEDCVVSYRRTELQNSTVSLTAFAHPLGGVVNRDSSGNVTSVTGRPIRCRPRAFGIWGTTNASCFAWPSTLNQEANNVWVSEDYLGHGSGGQGIFTWQNDYNVHDVVRPLIANCAGSGIDHGAYRNAYRYLQPRAVSCSPGFELHAAPATSTFDRAHVQSWLDGATDLVTISRHNLPGLAVGLVRGGLLGGLVVNEDPAESGAAFDFVNTGLDPSKVTVKVMHPASVIRLQQAGQAWQITPSGVTPIPVFA